MTARTVDPFKKEWLLFVGDLPVLEIEACRAVHVPCVRDIFGNRRPVVLLGMVIGCNPAGLTTIRATMTFITQHLSTPRTPALNEQDMDSLDQHSRNEGKY